MSDLMTVHKGYVQTLHDDITRLVTDRRNIFEAGYQAALDDYCEFEPTPKRKKGAIESAWGEYVPIQTGAEMTDKCPNCGFTVTLSPRERRSLADENTALTKVCEDISRSWRWENPKMRDFCLVPFHRIEALDRAIERVQQRLTP